MANRKKTDWNSRIKPSEEDLPIKKKNMGFILQSFKIEEILDESGEVLDDTVIRFNLDGILFCLSIADAIKFSAQLERVLNFKS